MAKYARLAVTASSEPPKPHLRRSSAGRASRPCLHHAAHGGREPRGHRSAATLQCDCKLGPAGAPCAAAKPEHTLAQATGRSARQAAHQKPPREAAMKARTMGGSSMDTCRQAKQAAGCAVGSMQARRAAAGGRARALPTRSAAGERRRREAGLSLPQAAKCVRARARCASTTRQQAPQPSDATEKQGQAEPSLRGSRGAGGAPRGCAAPPNQRGRAAAKRG